MTLVIHPEKGNYLVVVMVVVSWVILMLDFGPIIVPEI